MCARDNQPNQLYVAKFSSICHFACTCFQTYYCSLDSSVVLCLCEKTRQACVFGEKPKERPKLNVRCLTTYLTSYCKQRVGGGIYDSRLQMPGTHQLCFFHDVHLLKRPTRSLYLQELQTACNDFAANSCFPKKYILISRRCQLHLVSVTKQCPNNITNAFIQKKRITKNSPIIVVYSLYQ
jgi:hypothetical protein